MKTIVFPLKPQMKRREVGDLHKALALMGLEVTVSERKSRNFGASTREAVRKLQSEYQLKVTGVVDKATADLLNHQPIEAPPAGGLSEEMVFTVEGEVSSRRAGVGGLRVEIVDKYVGGDQSIKETVTDDGGAYQVAFTIADLPKRGKQRPDLQARVFAARKFLGASEVRYNASNSEKNIDVVLTEEAASALPSEYDTLTGALSAHFKGKLGDLKETDDRQDITYLANKTGWDARAVALAALADQFSERNGKAEKIPPVFFYALFRAGLPANEETLYHVDAKTLEAVWKKAAEQGVIPKDRVKEIPRLIQRFQTVSAQRLLTGPAAAGVSSLKEMLIASRLDNAQQKKFAELYAAHRTNMPTFWKAATKTFGKDPANRLQMDGKLGFLTINNAPLMQKLHKTAGDKGLSDPLQLAQKGYHRKGKWKEVLTQEVAVPKEIPGNTAQEKRANYAEYLAAQVRLSYPTAAVAEMVKSNEIGLLDEKGRPLSARMTKEIHTFLTDHQGKFEIGVQPVEQYLRRNKIKDAPKEAITQIKRIQRVYQITPSDQAMTGLLKRGVDAAYHVVRYQKENFVQSFAKDLKALGETEEAAREQAAQTYDRSVQVHNAVLNITMSYLTASNAPGIGVHSPAQIVDPTPTPPANADDVIAYSTLENLFGEMDYCACDHCRSILSPAAYLVDLLHFLDRIDLPANENPLPVLLSRRPDIEHLPLTCENTNTVLPYIDVVNETLEYYIANDKQKLSLKDYTGHDTDGAASEDLLASPQFVMESAYTTLLDARFPAPLPFHQPLEKLRRYFDKFDVSLTLAMERLRKNNVLDVDRTTNPAPPLTDYGWRDILMEEIGLSRAEYEILTISNAAPNVLWQIYGYPVGTTDTDVINGVPNIVALSKAKDFTRRVGITYEDLIAILRTRFVNPNSDLIPKLERLGVSFDEIKKLEDADTLEADAAFDALLPTGAGAPDPEEYDGDIKAWVKDDTNYARIMGLITLTDTSASQDPCSFDTLEFRHAQPMADETDTSTRLGAVEFVRLLRFIRLWKKTGWTIEQTDAAICALYRADMNPLGAGDIDTVAKLNAGFLMLLPRLGVVKRVMNALNLTPNRDLLSLLACFAPIDAHDGMEWFIDRDQSRRLRAIPSLYRQMFLNPAILERDDVFGDDGYGNFLDGSEKLADHAEALRSAFNLTGEEYERIVSALGFDANTPLILANISKIFRRGWLARKLKLSVRELLLLMQLTGLDPFAAPDPTDPAILRLISLVQAMKDRSFKSEAALYLIWNQDLSGKSHPELAQVTELARTLRGDFAGIEDQFAATEAPSGDVARVRMALVYGQETTDAFFALLDDTLVVDVAYTHPVPELEAAITAVDAKIAYDHFRHRLSHTGVLIAATQVALKAVAGVTAAFQTAVDMLFARSEVAKGSFFTRYRELEPLYNDTLALDRSLVLEVAYIHPVATLEAAITAADSKIAYDNIQHQLSYTGVLTAAHRDTLKTVPGVTATFQGAMDALFARSEEGKVAVLAALLPELSRRRKRQQALQRLSAAAAVDLAFSQALLDPFAAPYPLHAAGHADQPVLNDVLALETPGLAAQFFYRDTATGAVGLNVPNAANLDYDNAGSNPLPPNTTPGNPISGMWRGSVETPEAGFCNFVIEADADATVTLELDGQGRPLTKNGNVRRNTDPIELKAGTLYEIVLTVEKVKDALRVQWETPKRAREVIPSRYLYPPMILAPFSDGYIRFLKAASLAEGLGMTANEMAHFATHADYRINAQGQIDINGQGWLNALPNADNLHLANPADATIARTLNATLLTQLRTLLDYARIKTDVSPDDELLLNALQDPVAATVSSEGLLYTLTRWDANSLAALLNQFGGNIAGLSSLKLFMRAYDAFTLIRKMGISGSALINATTNEPVGNTVRDLQAALRARYDASIWRDVVQPINDAMRGLQRDALVAYILQQMRSFPESEHIDTPEKLFEYFLMDVQMEPCMQTSRIRHALSSLQLFIERCLMNLEQPRVSPAAINARQWEWMKRYRVWEANRKVFLFPENWLEPELRDDKSPFFKEIESELLQSDITEDSATTALLNYLSKLEEVAKLEPCGIYHVEGDGILTGNVDHVIARTAGAHRKYYYRRYEYGYWTPWEQVKLDIEDNPVMPVVWNGRLLLFWLRILKQTPDATMSPPSGMPLSNGMDISEAIMPGAMKVSVRAVLCWSEYYNGKWQPTKTSDINQAAKLGEFPPAGNGVFDRSSLQLSVVEEMFERVGRGRGRKGVVVKVEKHELLVSVDYEGKSKDAFLLYNTHSLPVLENAAGQAKDRICETSNETLTIEYAVSGTGLTRHVLKNEIPDGAIEPRHPLKKPFVAPFFYEDSRHVFYVTTAAGQPVWIEDHFGRAVNPSIRYEMEIPQLILKTDPRNEVGPKFWGDGRPVVHDPGHIDPVSPILRYVTEDAYIHRGIGTTASVKYGNRDIGPSGAIPDVRIAK
jgi:hypothetical protein